VADHRSRVWKHVAFLGRYGHQQADMCLSMPTSELRELSSAVADLMREEADAMKTET